MKLSRIIIMTLGVSLAGGLAGSALANDGRGRHDERYDRDGRRDHDRRDGDRGRWDRGDRWAHTVPVRFVNERRQPVTLFVNGRYLGRIAPMSRERIALPVGHHVVTYKVGWRDQFHQLSVSAFPGRHNRVVIEGRRGWGRW
jgi:hypothetical protein